MTQKELLYFEDAIMHEDNTINIIDLSISNLEDEDLIFFVNFVPKLRYFLIRVFRIESAPDANDFKTIHFFHFVIHLF